jgi:small subunit ribosomal protein S16
MPARMRLQRYGKKGMPFYHIVIADGRAPRDGKFVERIGTYNPLAKPADINLDFDKAMEWLRNGAQPSDTVNAILRYKGVLMKMHLQKGVAKGALSQEQADVKFNEWLTAKEDKISSKINETELTKKEVKKKRLEAEVKINEVKAAALAKKRAAEVEAQKAATTVEAPIEEASKVTEEPTAPEVAPAE